jgi:hypothetical protein
VAKATPTEFSDLGFQHRFLKPVADRLPDQGLFVIAEENLLRMSEYAA